MLLVLVLTTCIAILDCFISTDAGISDIRPVNPNRPNEENVLIVSYKKAMMSEADVQRSMRKLERHCRCDVRRLTHVGAFILKYKDGIQADISQLHLDSNLMSACDDGVIRLNPPRKINKVKGHKRENFLKRPSLMSNNTPVRENNEIDKEQSGTHENTINLDIRQTPTDPSFNQQWPLANLNNDADINAQSGWDEYLSDPMGASSTCPAVIVAVIDTGVDYNHPDLQNVMWVNPGEIPADGIDNDGNGIVDDIHGADFSNLASVNGNPMDGNGHGTHCAGIIAAEENNGIGIAGVASFSQEKVSIMAVKGFSDSGFGTLNGLLMSLEYALENGAKISSNSWGSTTWNPAWDPVWSNVLQNNPQHIVVAASGNQGQTLNQNNKKLLCGLDEPNLLCVASSKITDQASSFSNIGKELVHVFAPGQHIYSTDIGSSYSYKTGTSMACPHATGLAALILTMRDKLIGQDVRQLIECGAQKKPSYKNLVSSGGLIDVLNTIKVSKIIIFTYMN